MSRPNVLSIELLMSKASPEPNSGCWIWLESLDGPGYGIISINGKRLKAHRLLYELIKGPIPNGLELDHLCRVRCCVNPQHLEAVPHYRNIQRSPLMGREPPPKKTHCRRGHPYDLKNTLYLPGGYYYCRECRRQRRSPRHGKGTD